MKVLYVKVMHNTVYKIFIVFALLVGVSCSSVLALFCCHYKMYEWQKNFHYIYSLHNGLFISQKGCWCLGSLVTNGKLVKLIRTVCTEQFLPPFVSQQCTTHAMAGGFSSLQSMTCNNELHTMAWPYGVWSHPAELPTPVWDSQLCCTNINCTSLQ